ncbi:MAG TPA: hypothetical protein VMT00_11195 [Thermoanaerobaculia bacterium]|nr:hypothetical protein [Thermoanaerobaculia bacterium]
MKNLALCFLLLFAATPLFSQASSVGFLGGVAQPIDDGFDFDFDDSVRELFFATELQPETFFRIKLGKIDTSNVDELGEGTIAANGKVEYVQALIAYRFYEIFGSTSVFAGPSYYRQRFGEFEETDYGLSAGVTGMFPVTRRLAVLGELSYHWANFEERRRFLTATAGFQFGF